ncbi:MAG: hypothetical protein ACUVQM_00525 [Candidatus Hadarchaeaceae archaeon]
MVRDSRGVESLPVVVLIGAILTAGTVSIGVEAISRAQRMTTQRRAIESFDLFVEQSRILCAGGLGDSRFVYIELGDGLIVLKGNIVQLLIGGTARSELLPLPVLESENELRSGIYFLQVCRGVCGFFIKVERA